MKMPSFIGKILNSASELTATQPASAAPAASTAPLPSGGDTGYATFHVGDASGDLSGFQKKYGAAPYLTGHFRSGHYFSLVAVPISLKMVQDVARKIGSIIPASDKTELAKIYEEEKKLDERMSELGFYSSTVRWQAMQERAKTAIQTGQPEIAVPSRQDVVNQISEQRRIVHLLFRETSTRVYNILKPACDKFGNVARQFVLDLDQQEKSDWAKLYSDDIPFKPSDYLKAMVYVALVIAESPVRGYELAGSLRAPNPSEPLISLWLKCTPSAVPAQPVSPQPVTRPEVAAREADVKERQAAAEAVRAAKHKAEIEKKNALLDLIRSSIKKDADDAELAGVRAQIAKDARVETIRKQIAAEQDAAQGSAPPTNL